ncbi:carbohydrate ABC transporter permease [Sutcliffiella horikoshii]|uniref:Sugar ABC transporter permease n=1 Tax=Sutcliffiella horikoshii TaxID=79883 RepID=A0A5D4TIB1_9BACI|nr:sugar ABC transporter permease [Sutcliffiella horikoshii]TYS60849.1 sugar ABC transporter permease [Sutcliffiella horikoshii]TYS73904.1 sugar ABC transporter permease [Sutcliffiella horikoshii]
MKQSKWLYLFFVPGLIFYSIFFILPTISAVFYSFTDWDGLTTNFNFVGFENYTNLVTNDSIFIKSMTNNLKFMLFVVVFQTLFSLVFAVLLVKNTKTNIFLRALYFFPTILSSVSVAFIWSYMYDPNLGIINNLFTSVGLEMLANNWLGDQNIAIYSIAFVQVWFHTGQMLIIFVAGLQAIPEDLYEVAKIEGASRWQTFSKVTWPLIAPAATIVVAYTTIQSFKAFDLIYAMTRGGPNYATEILATHIYTTAFRSFKFGYASAESVIFMLVIALITFLQFRVLRANRVEN